MPPTRIRITHAGSLSKYGYTDLRSKTTEERRKSLARAVKVLGPVDIIRRLNALAILQRNTNPSLSQKLRSDQRWISKHTTILH